MVDMPKTMTFAMADDWMGHMSRLSTSERKALPASDFAGGKGHFPIENIEHGRLADQMASHAGPAEAAKIRAAVHRKFPSIKTKAKPRMFGSLKHG